MEAKEANRPGRKRGRGRVAVRKKFKAPIRKEEGHVGVRPEEGGEEEGRQQPKEGRAQSLGAKEMGAVWLGVKVLLGK